MYVKPFQVLESDLNGENCLDYLDKACLFRASNLIRCALKIALEDPQVSITDDDWKSLSKKHPELAVELAKYRSGK